LIAFVTPHRRFIPIVVLALVFNVTNVIGFTYACVPFNPLTSFLTTLR
jgi:hypothetical protein